MLACTALVGCTNEDEPVVDNGQNQESIDAFVSVKLVMSDAAYSRAVNDAGYAAGSEAERTIDADNSIFLFYDVNGKWVTSGKLVTQTPATGEVKGDHTQANSQYGDAYIALSGPEGELVKSAQVLTVINYSACNNLKQLNLDEALKEITSTTTDPIAATGKFLMTTSTYMENNVGEGNDVNKDGISNTTKIDGETNICATQDAAKKAPVKIYVERASAKVEVKFNTEAYDVDGDNEDDAQSDEANGAQGGDIVVDGNLQAVSIKVNGVKLNNTNEETYLTKRLLSSWATTVPFTNWNYASNYRSYWAEGTKYDTTVWSDANGSILTSYTYNEAIIASETPMYCYEQTVANPNVIDDRSEAVPYPNVSTVLVAAEISGVKVPSTTTTTDEETGETTTTTTMVDYTGNLFQYGGVFYSEANYKNLILKQIQDEGYVKAGTTDGSYISLDAEDLTIVTDGSLSGIKITVSTANTYYKDVVENKEGETVTYSATQSSANAIETFLNGSAATDDSPAVEGNDYVKEAIGYANGKCYYQIPIEHLSSAENNLFYGVVRNHWYKLTISGVKHIGEAVFNPTIKIPEIPEKNTEYYMAVQLHVLSWHVMEQDVTLE